MNFLLEITEENYTQKIIDVFGLPETALFGLQIVLVGMLTVFAVLLLIMIALKLFELVFSKAPKEKKVEEPVASAPVPVSVPTADEEIVAVIAAAIAMAEAESGGLKFRVVSFRRK